MLAVKTPEIYINRPGAIREAGKYIVRFGKRPLILGGAAALDAVKEELFPSLDSEAVDTSHTYIFSGYPSETQFQKYSDIAQNISADLIIGVGGGRALDTAKAVADMMGLPAVTIPTIAATCAAWAAVTIQYDDEGAYVQARGNKQSARLVIADPNVIFTAPKRYLFSGVVDTFAKLYETRPAFERYPENAALALAVHGSRIAFEKLEQQTFLALEEAEQGVYAQASEDVIDAIIYLAGFAGSFQEEGIAHYGFAHPFYHVSTRLANTRHKLHGEKVAFGIVAQLFLEGKPEKEIIDTIRLFDKYNAAFTLKDIGVDDHLEEDLRFLRRDVRDAFPYVTFSEEEIEKALLDADLLTKRALRA